MGTATTKRRILVAEDYVSVADKIEVFLREVQWHTVGLVPCLQAAL